MQRHPIFRFLSAILKIIGIVILSILFIFTIISLYVLHSCENSSDTPIYNYEISGIITDETHSPLDSATISFKDSCTSTTTDSLGQYTLYYPNSLWIEISKKDYQPKRIKLINFSEYANYEFDTIVLTKSEIKTNDLLILQPKVSNPFPKQMSFSGKVCNEFGKPLQNAKVSLTDSIFNCTSDKEGNFKFHKNKCTISFNRLNYNHSLTHIDIRPRTKQLQKNITLVQISNRKGIYLLASDKYIAIPKVKLHYDSEEKTGKILWGGNHHYNINKYYYSPNAPIFKIDKNTETPLRFILFDTSYDHLFKQKGDYGFICTVDYKYTSFLNPEEASHPTQSTFITQNDPSRIHCQIIEFTPDSTNQNYVFFSPEHKNGFIFSY